MAEGSKIEWTTHTFNPWIGCTKVSDGCKNCYAEMLMDKRYHKVEWGPDGVRIKTGAGNWREPLRWNTSRWICSDCGKAYRDDTGPGKRCLARIKIGVGCNGPVYTLCGGALGWVDRPRVFCSSLADVFEVKTDQQPETDAWRLELFDLIRRTPNLDWLMLTKRPQSIRYCIGRASMLCQDIPKERVQDFVRNGPGNCQEALFDWVAGWHQGTAPANVWMGTSVEGDISRSVGNPIDRIAVLADVHARVRFLSVEPLIAPFGEPDLTGIHWAIVGGESGASARPMNIEWARSVRDQCAAGSVAFFMKQLGGVHNKRHDLDDFPTDLRIREFPEDH